jgi:hypothetical protein
VKVTYQLAPDDFYQGMQAWRDRRKWLRWARWIADLIAAVELLICLLLVIDRGPAITAARAGIGFGVVWFAWILIVPRFFSRRQFKNQPICTIANHTGCF